ncbi:MAG: hypothetical protein ABI977_18210, partial [Acidobacteriota bacterium]
MPQNFLGSFRVYAQAALLLCLCISLCLTGFARSQAQQTSKSEKYLQLVRTFHTPAEFQKLTRGKVKITRNVPKEELSYLQSFAGTPRIDWGYVTVIARQGVPLICLGTRHGAFVFLANVAYENSNPQYFGGKRWLPDDHVTGAGFEDAGSVVWIETPKGFSRIEYKEMTLAEKSKAFV